MKDADLKALEAKGTEGVLREMMQGLHGDPNSPRRSEVEAWLRSKQLEAEGEAAFKRDAHEEKTLSISKEANRIALEQASAASRSAEAAWEQARWAKWATIIAAIAIIIAVIAAREDIKWLISWLTDKIKTP